MPRTGGRAALPSVAISQCGRRRLLRRSRFPLWLSRAVCAPVLCCASRLPFYYQPKCRPSHYFIIITYQIPSDGHYFPLNSHFSYCITVLTIVPHRIWGQFISVLRTQLFLGASASFQCQCQGCYNTVGELAARAGRNIVTQPNPRPLLHQSLTITTTPPPPRPSGSTPSFRPLFLPSFSLADQYSYLVLLCFLSTFPPPRQGSKLVTPVYAPRVQQLVGRRPLHDRLRDWLWIWCARHCTVRTAQNHVKSISIQSRFGTVATVSFLCATAEHSVNLYRDRPPPNLFPAGQPPSFKTNVNRMKTKKWVEAKQTAYDGGDWGDYDEYDEYGTEQAPPPPHPIPPTGYRQPGQVGGAPSRSFTDPQRGGPPQQVRRNSFEAGDERQAFSAAMQQHGHIAGLREASSHSSSLAEQPGHVAPSTYGATTQPSSVPIHPALRQPSGAESDISDTPQHRRDFTPSALPPPLQTRISPAPGSASASPSGTRFPARKSSLSQMDSPASRTASPLPARERASQ